MGNTVQTGSHSGCCIACSGLETFATIATVETQTTEGKVDVVSQMVQLRGLQVLTCAEKDQTSSDGRYYDPARNGYH